MATERLVQFLGVNLRKDKLSLRDEDVARAINADLHTLAGVARLRRGRVRLATLGDAVRAITSLNGARYTFAGSTLYRGTSSLITGLHPTAGNTALAMKPLTDPTTWVFVADTLAMQKVNAGTVRTWGIATPITPPSVAVGPAGTPSGVYSVKFTYVRKNGSVICHEGNPSDASASLTVASQQITLADLDDSTDAQVTHKRIYRTVNSGSTYLFDQEIAQGVTTATCTIADSALGAAVETDNNTPPLSHWATLHQEHVFFLDPSNPSYLWWSKRYRPESVPSDNYIDIGTIADPLNGLVSLVGLLGVFTRNTKYRVLGNSTSGFVHQEALSSRGTPAPQAALVTEHGCLFPARDGLFLTNFVQPDEELSGLIAPIFEGETVNEYLPINWTYANTMAMAYYKQRLYFAYPSGDSTTPDMMAVYSFHTKQWYFYQMACRALYYEEASDYLLAGHDSGDLSRLEYGSDDDGGAIAMTLEPATRAFTEPFLRKSFTYLSVDVEAGSATVTCTLYVDGTAVHVLSVTGSRQRRYVRLNGLFGYTWRVVFTYTGTSSDIAVYGVEVQAVPLKGGA